ncbi:hypothetical protein PanWU01x14_341610 [Parasponia andersonii]|uniref:Uncharacterized protein n=1 Tax=Parasponia andersonii TaxID=3476 RepID=A0A2P5ADZ0_PARAD|nr:hypothetical protein PanWU01x14_341610 [Parasponia andersonii]
MSGVAVASSAEDAPPPAVVDSALSGPQLSFIPTTAASGASPVRGKVALAVGRVESHSADANNAQREGPATELELEALSLENIELVASRTFTALTEEFNSRSALAEHSKAALAELRTDFDLYRSLDKARVSSAEAHALSVERVKCEELATRLAKAEANRLAQSEDVRLTQNELKARKAEARAKVEAHSLHGRLDQSNKAELRLTVLRDRLADVEKLKMKYQRSGWENREFEGHTEVVTLDQFDEQKGIERDHYSIKYYIQQLGDETNIVYPADVLKMLAVEKDRPSTSASVAKELIPISGPLDDDSDPGLPSSTGAGPSAETGCAPLDRDIIYDAVPLSAVQLAFGLGSVVQDFELLVGPPRAMIEKISSRDRDVGFSSSNFKGV